MADTQYAYAVARIRAKELSLLSGAFLEQLVSSKTYEECLRLLNEKGWETGDGENTETMLTAERNKTWKLIGELVKDPSVFDVFLYANDYHNLKAAIKSVKLAYEYPGIYTENGTVEVKRIRQAAETGKFGDLPEAMRGPAEEAYRVFLETGDGQLCDIIIDRAALLAIYQAGQASGNEFLALYGELSVASADIKTAVRAAKTGKDKSFLKRALAPCRTLDIDRLAAAAAAGTEAIAAYLVTTSYADAVEELRKSPSAFERWCDNLMIRRIRPQKRNPFGLGPLAAYILARENEIKSVRIILAGKRNALSDDMIRERVREMYV